MNTKSIARKILWEKRRRSNLCVYCGVRKPKTGRLGCRKCLKKKVELQKIDSAKRKDVKALYRKRVRKSAIDKYGGVCKCCGEENVLLLTIDHINNDGGVERRSRNSLGNNSTSSTSYYTKLIRSDKRPDLQVLCYNCNLGRFSNGGVCPHKSGEPDLSKPIDFRTKRPFNIGCKINWLPDNDLVSFVNKVGIKNAAESFGVHKDSIRYRLKRRGLYNFIEKATHGQGRIQK